MNFLLKVSKCPLTHHFRYLSGLEKTQNRVHFLSGYSGSSLIVHTVDFVYTIKLEQSLHTMADDLVNNDLGSGNESSVPSSTMGKQTQYLGDFPKHWVSLLIFLF